MPPTLSRGLGAALALGLALLVPAGAGAEVLSLSRDAAIDVARQAWLAGDVALAYAISGKIVAAEPGNVEALLLLSAATGALGHPEAALGLARRAWAAAAREGRPPAFRQEIALQAARVAMLAEAPRRAAIWLDRAALQSGDEATRAQMRADAQGIRAKLPLSFAAGLHLSPTDNLNNGASTGLLTVEDLTIGTLSGWSVAHAGIVADAQLDVDYALGTTDSGLVRNSLGLSLGGSFHWLTPSEARAEPTLDASELDMTTATLRWRHDRLWPGVLQGPMRLTLEAGQSWFGGAPYAPTLRATADVPLAGPGAGTDLMLSATLERQWLDAPSGIVNGASLRLTGERDLALPWGEGGIGFALGVTALRSGFANTTYDLMDASLSLDPGLQLGPVTARFGLGLSFRHHEDYSLIIANVTRGRTDKGASLSASFALDEARLGPFTPEVTLMRRQVWSNISKYEMRSTTVQFGLASEF